MPFEFISPKSIYQIGECQPGHLAVETDPKTEPQWYGCREQFQNQFNETTKGILYAHEGGKEETIATFINKTEDIIRIGMEDNGYSEEFPSSVYARTNRPKALWIGPSPFWVKCPMRRSLFTALLRCAQKSYVLAKDGQPDNYEIALWSQSYTSFTKDATQRFLFGFTIYVNDEIALRQSNRSGWQSAFSGKDRRTIKKQLVAKPEDIRKYQDPVLNKPDIIGLGDTLFR